MSVESFKVVSVTMSCIYACDTHRTEVCSAARSYSDWPAGLCGRVRALNPDALRYIYIYQRV
jgi:hypothetical protein